MISTKNNTPFRIKKRQRCRSTAWKNPFLHAVLLALAGISLMTGCRPANTEWPPFDGQRAFEEVKALVQFSPRDAGTPNGRKAAQHIAQRLENMGIDTETDTFTDITPEGEKTFHNVYGRISGRSDRWIIIGSHFDTMPGIKNFQGANDSGSSTGVLLELARIMSGQTPETGILFAFFDGEEGIAGYIPGDGLHGSRRLASQLVESGRNKTVKAMILLDMVGDRDLHFSIPRNSSRELIKLLLDAARDTSHRDRFSLATGSFITDDHVPFLQIGIPAIDIIDFSFGSEPGLNDYWHTEADNMEHISAESLQIIGEVSRELIRNQVFE